MLKILLARLQQYVNCELPDIQGGFRKCRETRDQIANICWIIEKSKKVKQTNKQKSTPTSALLTMQKPLCGSRQNVENSERDENTRPPYLPPEKICMQVKKQQLELDMEQQTGSK